MAANVEKLIQIQYFALLREQRGAAQETIETCATTAEELYKELQLRHGLTLPLAILKVAINNEFRDWGSILEDQDCVTFIQPVAGG